jgi:hypothetical protein
MQAFGGGFAQLAAYITSLLQDWQTQPILNVLKRDIVFLPYLIGFKFFFWLVPSTTTNQPGGMNLRAIE